MIPGGGTLAPYDKNNMQQIAYACNSEATGIVIPATIKDDHLTFDYTVDGGASLPIYAIIVESFVRRLNNNDRHN